MNPNQVKQKLKAGETVLGTMMFEFPTTGIARLAAVAGAEFAVFDMEHTGWDIETIRMLVATTPRSEMVPVVRIPACEYHFVARVLDAGAMGIMVPMVESEEQARLLVASANYPPVGRRGAAFTIAHDDYRNDPIPDVIRSANDGVLLIAQIETVKGLENVEQIAAVAGIDVLWIGLFDLTSSMGIPGQMQHPDTLAAIQRVLSACRTHGKIPAVLVNSVPEGQAQLQAGFRMVAYGGDLWIYQSALRKGLSALREELK
jgi:2-dehydro-3-deoxyglucarate aldolase/4-hydroxy-2-oxoheptanedioate aldolase